MKQIWHIYYGTRGTAGSYIDALVKSSTEAGLPVKAFVSANYTYKTPNCVRCFFPYTDKSEKRNSVILAIRGLELVLAYLYIAIRSVFKRPTVNIHLIDDLKVTYYLFLFFKMLNLKVYITCHDIQSHYTGMTSMRSAMMTRADKLVVHNANAKTVLVSKVGEKRTDDICVYPFPCSSFDEILDRSQAPLVKQTLFEVIPKDKPFYLFLGVVRFSKGIELLLGAWKNSSAREQATLVIAGKWTDPNQSIRKMADEDSSCIVIDKYVSDEEFVTLIELSKFAVLPYLDYVHSAVLYSCGYHGGAVITSDISLFTETMSEYPLTFSSGNQAQLSALLDKTSLMSDKEVACFTELTEQAIQHQQHSLVGELKLTYSNN